MTDAISIFTDTSMGSHKSTSKRSSATKLLAVRMLQGYKVTNARCSSCDVPILEFQGSLVCVVCTNPQKQTIQPPPSTINTDDRDDISTTITTSYSAAAAAPTNAYTACDESVEITSLRLDNNVDSILSDLNLMNSQRNKAKNAKFMHVIQEMGEEAKRLREENDLTSVLFEERVGSVEEESQDEDNREKGTVEEDTAEEETNKNEDSEQEMHVYSIEEKQEEYCVEERSQPSQGDITEIAGNPSSAVSLSDGSSEPSVVVSDKASIPQPPPLSSPRRQYHPTPSPRNTRKVMSINNLVKESDNVSRKMVYNMPTWDVNKNSIADEPDGALEECETGRIKSGGHASGTRSVGNTGRDGAVSSDEFFSELKHKAQLNKAIHTRHEAEKTISSQKRYDTASVAVDDDVSALGSYCSVINSKEISTQTSVASTVGSVTAEQRRRAANIRQKRLNENVGGESVVPDDEKKAIALEASKDFAKSFLPFDEGVIVKENAVPGKKALMLETVDECGSSTEGGTLPKHGKKAKAVDAVTTHSDDSTTLASISSKVVSQTQRLAQLEAEALRKHKEAEQAAAIARQALERMLKARSKRGQQHGKKTAHRPEDLLAASSTISSGTASSGYDSNTECSQSALSQSNASRFGLRHSCSDASASQYSRSHCGSEMSHTCEQDDYVNNDTLSYIDEEETIETDEDIKQQYRAPKESTSARKDPYSSNERARRSHIASPKQRVSSVRSKNMKPNLLLPSLISPESSVEASLRSSRNASSRRTSRRSQSASPRHSFRSEPRRASGRSSSTMNQTQTLSRGSRPILSRHSSAPQTVDTFHSDGPSFLPRHIPTLEERMAQINLDRNSHESSYQGMYGKSLTPKSVHEQQFFGFGRDIGGPSYPMSRNVDSISLSHHSTYGERMAMAEPRQPRVRFVNCYGREANGMVQYPNGHRQQYPGMAYRGHSGY
eukprot:g4120.t1 g4120   contig15:386590-389442(-)